MPILIQAYFRITRGNGVDRMSFSWTCGAGVSYEGRQCCSSARNDIMSYMSEFRIREGTVAQ